MQISIELDLPGIISSAVSAERIQPIVDKAIAEAVSSAIRDATGYSSPFRKALEIQLKDAMPHGLAIDDVAKFQHMANAAVVKAVHGANAATIQAAIAEGLSKVMPDVPASIKLSELIEKAREGFHKEKHEAFYAHYEPSEYGGGWFYLDSDESTSDKYRADMCLAFNQKGEVYRLKLDGHDITPTSLPNASGKFDGLLLSLYVGRSTIAIDLDADEVESAAEAQYD
ncbi:hypothetical protein [Comamonas sp.]|uniref:hypothetical protein n=1 Tax=Comamonas sp. TaxID=34028 RepID=UPI0025847BBA|nr:hypothetical protein [Comamonas sp.]